MPMYPLDRSEVLPMRDLNQDAFERFPVWSERYDYDELEDMERWGLDPMVAAKQLEENVVDQTHSVYTLLEYAPFPGRMRLFIRARLALANGLELPGYVMNEDAFCLGTFTLGEHYIFSRHPMLGDLNIRQRDALGDALGIAGGDIFPIAYETMFHDEKGRRISGSFMCGGCDDARDPPLDSPVSS